jgi:hypothetical protein
MPEHLLYASTETIPVERVERAISVVGAIHALACMAYVSQRSYQWFAGVEDRLATSQTPFIATTGLALQFVAALVLLLACLARACCFSRFDRWIAVSAIVLGLLWLYFGLVDGFPNYVRGSSVIPVWQMVLTDGCRELNQVIVPAVLAIAFIRRSSIGALGWVGWLAILLGCLCYLIPAVHSVHTTWSLTGWSMYWDYVKSESYIRDRFVTAAAFVLPTVCLIVLRRFWRIVASLPFVAWLVRDMLINIPERMDRWSKLAGMDLVLAVSRNLSFVTVMSTATLLGVFVFTLAGVPKPRMFGRRRDVR